MTFRRSLLYLQGKAIALWSFPRLINLCTVGGCICITREVVPGQCIITRTYRSNISMELKAFKQMAVQAFLYHRSWTLSGWWTSLDYQHSPWQLLGMYKSGRCHVRSLYSYQLNHSVYTALVHAQIYYFHVYLSLTLPLQPLHLNILLRKSACSEV